MERGFVPRQRNPALLFLVHVGITFKGNVLLIDRKEKKIAPLHRVMAKTFPLNAFSVHQTNSDSQMHQDAMNCKQPLLKSVMFPVIYTKCLIC